MLKRTLVAVILALGLAQSVSATPFVLPPACVVNTLDQYLLLDVGGCSIGDETGFSDFGFSVTASGGGAVPIAASDITVTPTMVGDQARLTFSSSGFSVTGAEFVTYELAYSIDPHPILFDFEDFMFASSPTAPGVASITTDLCLGALFVGAVCPGPGTPATLQVFHDGIAPQLSDSVAFAPLALIGVINTIDLRANGANADFSAFTNGVAITPEPASWLLMGSGLVGVRLLRARRRGRRS